MFNILGSHQYMYIIAFMPVVIVCNCETKCTFYQMASTLMDQSLDIGLGICFIGNI